MPTRRALLVLPLAATLDPARAATPDELWGRLAAGNHVALMRHAEAPGVGDPPGFRLEECATQRNLSEAGRAVSRRLGEEFRRRGVRVGRVLSSRWCRCLDTARLMELGAVGTAPEALDSFFERPAERDRAAAALRRLLAELPRDGTSSVLVTHQVNVTALTGIVPASGEIVLLALNGGGGYALAGRLAPR